MGFIKWTFWGMCWVILILTGLLISSWTSGCAPAAYMGYKQKEVVSPANETERLLINMNKLGCQVGLYEEELATYVEKRRVGCVFK